MWLECRGLGKRGAEGRQRQTMWKCLWEHRKMVAFYLRAVEISSRDLPRSELHEK